MSLILTEGAQTASIAQANARINLWVGSVRAGKTLGSSLRWVHFTQRGPDGPLAMIGKTERTIRRNVVEPLVDLCPPGLIKEVYGDGYIEIQGRRIYLVGANDAKAESKIRGWTLAGAYGDEVTTWPEGFLEMLLTRLSIDDAQFFGTTNPDGPFHPVKLKYIDKADELDMKVFQMTLDDNPGLSEKYKADVIAEMKAAGPMYYQRYILGLWVAAEGAIYGLEPDGPYVIEKVPEDVSIIDALVCIDYGTTNPTVFLYLGLGDDDKVYVLDEWRHDPEDDLQRKTDAEFSAAFREWVVTLPYWDVPVVIDPSAASFITQMYREGIGGIRKANNAVTDGIRLTSTLLGEDRIRILKHCDGLIREMSSYVWDAKAAEKGEDKPVKKNDHGPDALRYGLMSQRARTWWRDWITYRPLGDEEDEAVASAP